MTRFSSFMALAALLFHGALAAGWAADRSALPGREIYRKLCASCHGRNGEGVKGKYSEPLRGQESIEKLARVIDQTMPDGDPSKCTGRDAEEVARYIYDAFYSPAAQARNYPPRVELAHLTHRQFANSVADLLGQFATDAPAPLPSPGGLSAVYYKSRNTRQEDKVLERVDPRVVFDFAASSPDAEKIKPEEFSMRWTGSILPAESGDHQFILRTPNGARLWVNQTDQPLIDAWVASGESKEHTATIRLIGGRAYPIQIDFFKFKDKSASITLAWSPPHAPMEPIPARSLSPTRVPPTFALSTPFPPDDSSVGYERGVLVSKAWDDAVTQAAIETANHVVKHLDRLARTKPDATNRTERVRSFCREFVAAAFRRPLSQSLDRTVVARHFSPHTALETSVRRVVLQAIKSPQFLYPDLGTAPPDGYRVAARLALAIWDSLPDRALIELASGNGLETREAVAAQAARMLEDPRARAKLRSAMHHWLGLHRVEELSKDEALFPAFTPSLVSESRASLDALIDHAVWKSGAGYRDLLLADYLFLTPTLADVYAPDAPRPLPPPSPDGFSMVKVPPATHSGVLTHPYLLAAFSYHKSSSPIHRGVFLSRSIVGRALRPPPTAVAFNDSDFAPNLTMREKIVELTRPQSCQSCHTVINPLGFSLENYDAIGRFRKQDNGRPVDATSEYATEDGRIVRFASARDVARFAVDHTSAQAAFVEQLFHEVAKQPALAYGPKVLDQLRQSWARSGFDVRKLVVEIALVSSLHGTGRTGAAPGR